MGAGREHAGADYQRIGFPAGTGADSKPQHGAWDNASTLPPGYQTFPDVLRAHGYRIAAVGKMHMNPTYQDIGFGHMQLAEQNGVGALKMTTTAG